jgi:hypothetical protein
MSKPLFDDVQKKEVQKRFQALSDLTKAPEGPFSLSSTFLPDWAPKLNPFGAEAMAWHTNRTDPPAKGKKFLIIIPFREHQYGKEVTNPDTGEKTFEPLRTRQFLKLVAALNKHLNAVNKRPGHDYSILLVEMADYDVIFTKGNVVNAGVWFAKKWGYDYFVAHDVDFYPQSLENKYDLPEDGRPVHMASRPLESLQFMSYGDACSGVFAASVCSFFLINGFPADYWGWGVEDDALCQNFDRYTGYHRLNGTAGLYNQESHSLDTARYMGLLYRNNEARFIASGLGIREKRTVPPEGIRELNATVLRYAPLPELGAVHWATVSLDTLRYRPTDDGTESKELQRKRLYGELPPLSDVGYGDNYYLRHEVEITRSLTDFSYPIFGYFSVAVQARRQAVQTSYLPFVPFKIDNACFDDNWRAPPKSD